MTAERPLRAVRLLLPLLAAVILAPPLHAQSPGQDVRLRTEAQSLRGLVLDADTSRLLLQTERRGQLLQLSVPRPCVLGAEVRIGQDSRPRRVARSVAQVAVVAAGVVVVTGGPGRQHEATRPARIATMVLLPAGVGGLTIGMLRHGDHWQRVDASPPTPARRAATPCGSLLRPVGDAPESAP